MVLPVDNMAIAYPISNLPSGRLILRGAITRGITDKSIVTCEAIRKRKINTRQDNREK